LLGVFVFAVEVSSGALGARGMFHRPLVALRFPTMMTDLSIFVDFDVAFCEKGDAAVVVVAY
jgi:hypothetical protein